MNTLYKITKLQVREDAKNEKSNEAIKDANGKLAVKLMNLGFIAGGTFSVAEGDVHEGYLTYDPEVGKPVMLSDRDQWFQSSVVVEITAEKKGVFLLKTQNSIYRLEPKK